MAEALAEVMTEGAFINGELIGISENRHLGKRQGLSCAPFPLAVRRYSVNLQ